MNILHISAAGKNTGAGSAALNIQKAQKKKGINARILFIKDTNDENNGIFSYSDNYLKRLIRFFFTTLDRFPTWFYYKRKPEIFSPGLVGIEISKHKAIIAADIIHLHWVNHGFISIKELKKIKKPIVWTMHDMWVITGGCHHSFLCNKYRESCGKCPILNSKNNNDLSSWVLKEKLKEVPIKNITFVAISSWMKGLAEKSALLKGVEIPVIFSGIDTSIFHYIERKAARDKLSLPQDMKIILLGANDLFNSAKGVQFSIKALAKMDNDILVITFGNGILTNDLITQKIINFGFINDRNQIANLYASSDLFLATSVAEAFGMTVAEAQCCGTPALAFDSSGPLDIIEHKTTGYLARYPNVDDLVNGISYLLKETFNRKEISRKSGTKFSIENTANQYINIYNKRLQQ